MDLAILRNLLWGTRKRKISSILAGVLAGTIVAGTAFSAYLKKERIEDVPRPQQAIVRQVIEVPAPPKEIEDKVGEIIFSAEKVQEALTVVQQALSQKDPDFPTAFINLEKAKIGLAALKNIHPDHVKFQLYEHQINEAKILIFSGLEKEIGGQQKAFEQYLEDEQFSEAYETLTILRNILDTLRKIPGFSTTASYLGWMHELTVQEQVWSESAKKRIEKGTEGFNKNLGRKKFEDAKEDLTEVARLIVGLQDIPGLKDKVWLKAASRDLKEMNQTLSVLARTEKTLLKSEEAIKDGLIATSIDLLERATKDLESADQKRVYEEVIREQLILLRVRVQGLFVLSQKVIKGANKKQLSDLILQCKDIGAEYSVLLVLCDKYRVSSLPSVDFFRKMVNDLQQRKENL